jgi:pyrimidine operon attenuation protein/uracil phosphoribosyltransferase
LSVKKNPLKNKSIVLIDDVLNTGKTLIYCVKSLLDVELYSFKTVVLIDRNHKKYPVKVDFKGISLSTSIADHVELILDDNDTYAIIK